MRQIPPVVVPEAGADVRRVALQLPEAPRGLTLTELTRYLDAVDRLYAVSAVGALRGYEEMPSRALSSLTSADLSKDDRLVVERLGYGSLWETVFVELSSQTPLALIALVPLASRRVADAVRTLALVRSEIRRRDAITDAIRESGQLWMPTPSRGVEDEPSWELRPVAHRIVDELLEGDQPAGHPDDAEGPVEQRRRRSQDIRAELDVSPAQTGDASSAGTASEPVGGGRELPEAVIEVLKSAVRDLSSSGERLGSPRVIDVEAPSARG
jgi:hypothetical protein